MKLHFFHNNHKKTEALNKTKNPGSTGAFQSTVSSRYDKVNAAISELEAGHENRLAILYPMILSREEAPANMAANAICTYLNDLNASGIIRLNCQFREYTSMEWMIDWTHISLTDIRETIQDQNAYTAVLKLGTFHPNGYFRQKCMQALEDDETAFPFIVLRLNDWAEPVRDTAWQILSDKLEDTDIDTAVEMLPYISSTKKGQRYVSWQLEEIEKCLSEKILCHLDEISLDRVRDYIPATKRFLYKILICPDVLSKNAADRLLMQEKNGNEKALIISRILEHYECSEAEIEKYAKSKSPIVRKRAVAYKYDRLGSAWPGLEIYLLDSARGIRSDACYILRKHTDFDILSFYKARLHTPDEAAAILGIGENGTEKDAPLLAEYLYSATPKLIKYAMKALSSLNASGFEDRYWHYLNDTNVTIAKTAYEAVCKSDIHYGAEKLYTAYLNCENPSVRRYLLNLLVKEPSWERLPYLLLLYKPYSASSDHEVQKIQMLVRRGLSSRSVYAKISKKQADFITEIMDISDLELPEGLKKGIRFDLAHIEIR